MKKKKSLYVLCTECKKIYKFHPGIRPYLAIIFGSMGGGLLASSFYNNELSFTDHPIKLTIAFSLLIIGIVITSIVYVTQWDCEVCNSKKTLIKLDTPEAIEIIKDNNLTFPKESDSIEEKKRPWQA